jgi:hypothetical protein
VSNAAPQFNNGIPADQLEAWSSQGSVTNSSQTKEAIYNALDTPTFPRYLCDIFLQGSYANSTNTRGNSDVDVVVKYTGSYFSDVRRLPDYQQDWFQKETEPALLNFDQFHALTVKTLKVAFGESSVVVGKKAIKIAGDGNRLPADVIPCFPFKHFSKWISPSDHELEYEGIRFLTQLEAPSRVITNFPEQHKSNGEWKNSEFRTKGLYKPTVRMFKNARRYLTDKGKLEKGIAPSYFVECLLYNVPDECFVPNIQTRYFKIIEHLLNAEISEWKCQNSITQLFGSSPEQWNQSEALKLIIGWSKLYFEWGTI